MELDYQKLDHSRTPTSPLTPSTPIEIAAKWSEMDQNVARDLTTPCPRKKQATLIFDITSPSVDIFFTIFEAPNCSGLITGWCNLLHTHHRCEAFTWRDVTHDVIQAVARSAH